MSKKIWKPGTMLYPIPAVLITCGNENVRNVFTVAWTGILNTEPAMTYISVRKERYSYNILKDNMEFVINLVPRKLVRALDYCGVRSGAKEDKFKSMNLLTEQAQNVKAPLLKDSPVNIECRVKEIRPMGSHNMFVAEILSVDVDDKYLDLDGKFDMGKCDLVAYSHGQYYALGDKLGKFGFSVKKD